MYIEFYVINTPTFVIRLLRDGKFTPHTYKYQKITQTQQQQQQQQYTCMQ